MRGFFELGSPMMVLPVDGSEISMLLDTGFTGHLMLPRSRINELSLDLIGISDYLTASGSEHVAEVYVGSILLHGKKIEVPVLSTDADFALAGMELFSNSRILIERPSGMIDVSKAEDF